jgi:hypothetical protein
MHFHRYTRSHTWTKFNDVNARRICDAREKRERECVSYGWKEKSKDRERR